MEKWMTFRRAEIFLPALAAILIALPSGPTF
jgi:hypothetical protein